MIVLDTDILTILHRDEGEEYEKILPRLVAEDPKTVFATIISFEEHMRGWLGHISRKRKAVAQVAAYRRLAELLTDYTDRNILDFDEAAALKYEELRKTVRRLGTMDLKIAAIAIVNSAKVITRNLLDFDKVPDLVAEDWTR